MLICSCESHIVFAQEWKITVRVNGHSRVSLVDALIYSFIFYWLIIAFIIAFSALTLLVGRQEGHPACKKTERWGAGVVICLEWGADLHMSQLMPLPLTVSCFSKIQIGFTFLLPAHQGSPGKRDVKRVCVYVTVMSMHSILATPPPTINW